MVAAALCAGARILRATVPESVDGGACEPESLISLACAARDMADRFENLHAEIDEWDSDEGQPIALATMKLRMCARAFWRLLAIDERLELADLEAIGFLADELAERAQSLATMLSANVACQAATH